MAVTIIASVVAVVFIIGLSLLTTHKGYEYKQTIDPLPEDSQEEGSEKLDR